MIKKLIISIFIASTIAYAQDAKIECMIIKDENSIICKYSQKREFEDRTVQVNWIDPNGKVSRSRQMIVPAGHGSIYDFRYIKGRIKGKWIFQVIDNEKEYTKEFELK